ncbi:MAG: peptidoglycan editing factor PgeF [Erysipelotrichaceae bacterium]|nr:peptidoglycan editing factor PgeF [Erysipelotrichaceae bacterium]
MIKVEWKIHPNINAGTTDRTGGFSKEPFDTLNMALYLNDDENSVIRNREKLALQVDIPLSQWVFPKLTHSDRWIKVTAADAGKGAFDEQNSLYGYDAVYTSETNLALAVGHADCIPILFNCPSRHLIGALHTGWQGTVKQITDKFVKHWIDEEQCDPADIYVYIGPAIRKHNFIVKQDVINQTKLINFDVTSYLTVIDNEHTQMDLVGINIAMMLKLGIPRENITDTQLCTYDHPDDFFSYRRSKVTGRQLSFIVQT